MILQPWLWIVFTLAGALGQTVRNALQRDLAGPLGTSGATYVRFVYGLPFAILFLAIVSAATGEPLPHPSLAALGWVSLGAATQIVATAMMLMSMQSRSFLVVTAYTKTEPIQVAILGLVLLGDHLTPALAAAAIAATAGVVMMSWPRQRSAAPSWKPTFLGLGAASLFGLSAVAFRGAVLALAGGSYIVNASATLVLSLFFQSAVIVTYLLLRDRRTLKAVAGSWRQSFPAGFAGAFASQAWFLAFALESAARVRTLALVEIVFAQALARTLFKQKSGAAEWLGIALVVLGVVLLFNG